MRDAASDADVLTSVRLERRARAMGEDIRRRVERPAASIHRATGGVTKPWEVCRSLTVY